MSGGGIAGGGSVTSVELLRAGEICAAYRYVSFYGGAELRQRTRDAQAVYAFKKFGRRSVFFRALIEATAVKLECDKIVACPGSWTVPNILQRMFGTEISRVAEVKKRKYSHQSEISGEDEATLRVDGGAFAGAHRVLLVDDVATTGKSLLFVADVLRRAVPDVVVVPFALGVSPKMKPVSFGVSVDVEEVDEKDDSDLFNTAFENEPPRENDDVETLTLMESVRINAVRNRLKKGRSVPFSEYEEAAACLERIGDTAAASKLDDLMAAHAVDLFRSGSKRIDGDLVEWYRQIDPAEVTAWEGADKAPKSCADRKAESVSRRTSVPTLPDVVDEDRRGRCRDDLEAFGLAYCSIFLEHPPSDKMRPFITSLQNAILGSGLTHVRWPRGKGKTTWCKIGALWATLYGHRRYLVVVSATQEMADQIIAEMWEVVETGDELAEDFPEAALPIRMINGKVQRCAGQVYSPTGRLTGIRKSSSLLRFPTTEDRPSCGVRIQSRGIDSSVRGLVDKKQRPDFILFDDPQTDKTALSHAITRTYELQISKTFLGLMGHSRNISAAMTSTVIAAGDLSDRFANTNLHPEWKTHTTRLLERFPACWKTDADPWQTYFDLRAQDIQAGDTIAYSRSNAFYAANRARMDEGADVMDEADGDPAREQSAVQHAMNIIFTHGEDAFMSEYQLDPIRSASIFELQPENVSGSVNGLSPNTVPAECDALVATIDVMREKGLRWALTAFGPDRVAAVVAYGRFPANGQPLWSGDAHNEEHRAAALDLALRAVCGQFAGLRLPRADGGAPVPVSAVGIDAGYMSKTVATFCRRSAGLFPRLEPMRGMGWSKFAPLRTDGKKRGNVRSADDWAYSATTELGRFLHFHADFWREEMQRSWLFPPLQIGSLSVHGAKPELHHAFALEVCGDRLIDKDETVEGRRIWMWAKAGDNHFGDCLTMAFALAYWHKIYTLYARRETPADSAAYPPPTSTGGQPATPIHYAAPPPMTRRLMIVES